MLFNALVDPKLKKEKRIEKRRPYGERGERAYNGGLGAFPP